MVKTLLIIGLGGFLGSISRYLTQLFILRIFNSTPPIGTIVVNILGSFIIGVVFAYSSKTNFISNELKIFLTIGFCGGFTTFSSFTLDQFILLDSNQIIPMFIYTASSIFLGFISLYSAIYITSFFINN